jgi:membrane fusion protein (multidrug efflux system)
MRRTAVIALALLAGAAAGAWWFQPQLTTMLGLAPRGTAPQAQRAQPRERPPVPVEVFAATTGRVADQVEALGTLAANESVSVAPELAGRITAFRFTEGETVEQGAVLVELDATIARAEQEQARAALALAEDVFERNRTLVQRGAGTQVNLEQATAQLATARANLAASAARLEKLTINAPFKGVVGLRSVSVGTIVQPGQAIATLAGVDPVKLDFGVPELFLSSVRVGQSVDVMVDAVPGRRFQGQVYAIDPVVDPAGRALRLRATIPNADGALRPGLFARVNLTTGVREDAILLPESALVAGTAGASQAVYVVRDNRAALVPVKTGRRVEGKVEIVEGVSAGDQVVVAGQLTLRDGAAVTIAEPRQPAPQPASRSSAAAPATQAVR